MREKIKSIGLILAIVIAGISLPIGIVGIIGPPKQEFHTITFYNLGYYEQAYIKVNLEKGDVFSYSFRQQRLNPVSIVIYALTEEQLYGHSFSPTRPMNIEYWNQFFLEIGSNGAGYYQVSYTDVWCFFFVSGSTTTTINLTITYTTFN